MTAYNLVRFRVKPGREKEFVDAHRAMDRSTMKGLRKATLIKTGDRTYAFVGEWNAMTDIAAARSTMIANLDKTRSMLEDLGGSLGVTDPVSGDAVLELK